MPCMLLAFGRYVISSADQVGCWMRLTWCLAGKCKSTTSQGMTSYAEQQETFQRINASTRLLVDADLLPGWQVNHNQDVLTSFAEEQNLIIQSACWRSCRGRREVAVTSKIRPGARMLGLNFGVGLCKFWMQRVWTKRLTMLLDSDAVWVKICSLAIKRFA